jgi:hypothetical protein
VEQFEKVVKGLERFRADFKPFVGNSCDWERVDAAVALIRQQQAQIKELEQTACKNIEELSNRERDIRLYISTRINTLEQDRVNLLHYLGNVAEKDEEDLESDRNKRDGNAEKL